MDKVEILGEKIKKARKILNLSQDDLAGNNFTKSYISKIERGMVNPSMKALELIATRLNIPVSQLMDGKTSNVYDPRIVWDALKLYESGRYEESLRKFNEVIKYRDSVDESYLVRIYYYITAACIKLGKYEECVDYYNESLEMVKDIEGIYAVRLRLMLGEAYYYLNRRQDSLDTFLYVEKKINEHNLDIDIITRLELYNDIAILYSQLGETQLSKEYFKNIIALSKKNKIITETVLSAYGGLAQISVIYEQNADKSLAYLNNDVLSLYKYFEDYEHLGGIYLKYANAYYEKDDMEKFREYIEKMEEILPNVKEYKAKAEVDTFSTLYRGKLANKEGKYDEAERLMFAALEKADKYNELQAKTAVFLNLGNLYLNAKRLDESLRYLTECETLSHEIQYSIRLPELYQLMGKVYIKLGDVQKGQEYYDKAFKLLKEK